MSHVLNHAFNDIHNLQWAVDPGMALLQNRSKTFGQLRDTADQIAPAVAGVALAPYTGGASLAVASAYYGYKQQQAAADAAKKNVPPGAPTIDTAAQNQQDLDQIRRRRGALANIFGGDSSSGSPSVGTKTLLGQ